METFLLFARGVSLLDIMTTGIGLLGGSLLYVKPFVLWYKARTKFPNAYWSTQSVRLFVSKVVGIVSGALMIIKASAIAVILVSLVQGIGEPTFALVSFITGITFLMMLRWLVGDVMDYWILSGIITDKRVVHAWDVRDFFSSLANKRRLFFLLVYGISAVSSIYLLLYIL
ncbi:MAG TPA: hypothetical protein VJG85_01700 [Patescibacteria group bacterium]|nr:hypothetical protein [Patescibacteria group bacterium]